MKVGCEAVRGYDIKSYVPLPGILGNNRKVLCRTTNKKKTVLGSNSVENISVNCIGQNSQKICTTIKLTFNVN